MLTNMTLLGWLWLASPFVLIAVITQDQRLRELVAQHYERCRAAGWAGAAMMMLGTMVVPGPLGRLMFWIGTPLVGLVVWLRPDEGDDGGEEGPDVPPVDWGEFERSFWAHVRRRGRPPQRPRTPSAR